MGTRTGERVFAGLVGLLGLVWIVQARKLAYWGEFAPGPGFLPLWLGIVLIILVAAFLLQSLCRARSPRPTPAPQADAGSGAPKRVVAIVVGLLCCLVALEWLGFVVAVAVYLAVLIGVVERRSMTETLAVSIGTSVGLWLLFKQWLKVPFPTGPWGF